jgi:ATP-binding protein involved in chromosome partitioning
MHEDKMMINTIIDFLENKLNVPAGSYSIKELSDHKVAINCLFPIAIILKPLENAFSNLQFSIQQTILPLLTQLPGYGVKGVKNVIAVASGKGGVGKSTVSSNIACALSRLNSEVGLLDADIYGPSIPTMMGVHQKPEINQDNQYTPIQAHGVHCMSMGFLHQDAPLIWRGPMLAKALFEMLNQTAWPELDYLMIDLPPGTGDIPLSLVQKIPLSGAIIVTTPQTIATLDAEKAIQMFIKTNIPILGIVANMAWHACTNCDEKSYIFGQAGALELAHRYHLPLLGELPLLNSIREHGDKGQPIASSDTQLIAIEYMRIASNMTLELAKRPLNQAPKMPPIRVE